MTNLANARTKFFIGAATVSKPTDATFEAMSSWTLVDDVRDLGEFGDEAEVISFDVIGDGRKRKLKGTRDAGTMEITVARNAEDAGQIALRAAEKTSSPYAFKVLLEDGTVFYYAGLVMSHKRKLAGANDVIEITVSIDITSDVFEIEA